MDALKKAEMEKEAAQAMADDHLIRAQEAEAELLQPSGFIK